MLLLTTTDPLSHVITNTTTTGADQTGTTSPLGDGSAASYNTLHEPTVITDTQGYTTTTQYNTLGDPITVTDPLGKQTLYSYNGNGTVASMTDGNGHTTRDGYDAYGDTIAITDALGRASTMAYDTNISRLTSTTDPKHQTSSSSYDAEDRVTQVSYQDGSVTKNYIDADGNVTQTVDSGGTTSFVYDGDNRLTQETYPDGTVVHYTYDAAGRLASKSEPGMPLTSYSYDAAGNLTKTSNSLWGPITYTYDAANRLTALGYPNGVTTTYTDDADNRLTNLTEAKGGTTLFGDSYTFTKPGGGTWGLRSTEAISDPNGSAPWSYTYDADSRLTGASAAPPVTATLGTTSTGIITTVAGGGMSCAQTSDAVGDRCPATAALLSFPGGLTVDGQGNLFIGDSGDNMVREVPASTGVINAVAGTGTGDYSGDGGPATAADVNSPAGVAVDGVGDLFIGDTSNSRVREVAGSTGIIATVAGNGNCCSSGDGGAATQAAILYPEGVARDGQGDLFIADFGTHRVREVIASTGIITTVAGTGVQGFGGDGGPAAQAELNNPEGLAVDGQGDLFIADSGNNRVREVIASTGVITTVVGNGIAGFSGDADAATAAELNTPRGLTLDAGRNLFVADTNNNRVREVLASTGVITTVAGTGTSGFSGDGGAATAAKLNWPEGVSMDGFGDLFIADTIKTGCARWGGWAPRPAPIATATTP
jgi:YD repeat-containing protein